MTRKQFNTYLKDWQVWRLNPHRKLPSKFFDGERRRAYEVFNDTFFTQKACPAAGDIKVTINPVAHSGSVVAKVDQSVHSFRSTAASQWSTADGTMTTKRERFFSSPFSVVRNHDGTVRGITFERNKFKAQVNHIKWLAHNPDLVVKMIEQSQRRKRRIEDSALFM